MHFWWHKAQNVQMVSAWFLFWTQCWSSVAYRMCQKKTVDHFRLHCVTSVEVDRFRYKITAAVFLIRYELSITDYVTRTGCRIVGPFGRFSPFKNGMNYVRFPPTDNTCSLTMLWGHVHGKISTALCCIVYHNVHSQCKLARAALPGVPDRACWFRYTVGFECFNL